MQGSHPLHALGHQVKVNVHRPAEALHACHHAGLSAREALAPRLAAIRAPERAREEMQYRAAEPVIDPLQDAAPAN
jgi:hypothetical protein